MAGDVDRSRRSHAAVGSRSGCGALKRSWIASIITSIDWMVGSFRHTCRYHA